MAGRYFNPSYLKIFLKSLEALFQARFSYSFQQIFPQSFTSVYSCEVFKKEKVSFGIY